MRYYANQLRCYFLFRHRRAPSWWAWLGWRFGEKLCDVLDIPELIRIECTARKQRQRIFDVADTLPDEHRNEIYAIWGKRPPKRRGWRP